MTAITQQIELLKARRRGVVSLPQQLILGSLVILEIIIFAIIGTHFLEVGNFLEIIRINVPLGLIALAMTPVIMTGGIDLSVGSLMGLSAVVFGKLWRDAHLPPEAAACVAIVVGILAGGLNGLLITRVKIPPLIVTLGSFSLFRGIGLGITRGVDNYTGLPDRFLYLGQGYLFGRIPAQVPVFIVAAIFFWVLVHRSALGRTLSAIGFSPEGARHAGVPVEKQIGLVYVFSGMASALAAIFYVAYTGQARADVGNGYELFAITAVVLGGTSIFGGRATIIGSVLGLFAIAILQNGLLLADRPSELAGILTGVLLLVAIGAEWRPKSRPAPVPGRDNAEELDMRNSQLAVLCIVIVLAALIVTGGNFMLLNNLAKQTPMQVERSGSGATGSASTPATSRHLTIAMMPKSKGNAYFVACQKGAEEAAKELGADLIWDGPTDTDPAKQNEIVETWITRGVDVIVVSVENRQALSSALKKARDKGIKVVTFDADADPDARDFFVNQATAEGIGDVLMDDAAKAMGGSGEFAIITSTLTAANQNEWMKYVEARRAEKYPNITSLPPRPCDDQEAKATDVAKAILNSDANCKLIMAICSPAVPAAAEAVKQSGRTDVKVVGLGLPNQNKAYVHAGITDAVVLWNTMDLGYLAVYTAEAVKDGDLKPGDTTMKAGKLGEEKVAGDNVLLGTPFTFNKDNIDLFDF